MTNYKKFGKNKLIAISFLLCGALSLQACVESDKTDAELFYNKLPNGKEATPAPFETAKIPYIRYMDDASFRMMLTRSGWRLVGVNNGWVFMEREI